MPWRRGPRSWWARFHLSSHATAPIAWPRRCLTDASQPAGPPRSSEGLRNACASWWTTCSKFSRLQHGFEISTVFQPTDVVALIERLLGEARLAHPDVPLHANLPDELVAEVDPGRFSQGVANLLSNARHYGQGNVQVRANSKDGHLIVAVVNDGVPIPESMTASLFDPFKRLSADNMHTGPAWVSAFTSPTRSSRGTAALYGTCLATAW